MKEDDQNRNSEKIVKGIKWASIQFLLDTIFRLGVRLALARFLVPEEFGIIGMSTIFIAIAGAASELGMSAALIQNGDSDDAEAMYSTAFWTGICWGAFVFCVMSLAVGPLASNFYNEPRLLIIIPFLSLGILLRPLSMIHIVILSRKMDFKKMAQIFNWAGLVSGVVSLVLAYLHFGVWALVVNNTLSAILIIPMLFYASKWVPSFEWKKKYFDRIFGFGVYSTATSMFSTLTYNIDNLMIGKLLGATLLGSYTLAFSLTEQLRQIVSNVLNKVMYPVFGKVQHDKTQLRGYFLQIINVNAMLMFPLMTFILMFANEIVVNIFGVEWADTILPLQILSVAMMVHLLVNSFTSLLRGIGKPELELRIIMGLTVFVMIPSLFLGIHFFGLVGAAFAILINKFFLAAVGLAILKKEIDLKVVEVFIVIKKTILAVACSSLIVFVFKYYFSIDFVYLLGAIFVLFYGLLIFKFERIMILNTLKKMF